jgi:2-keto-4-pentenoate hydratase/2-oxohepta-3-ene-1,7-dioic acid hydratase in catechol pathway
LKLVTFIHNGRVQLGAIQTENEIVPLSTIADDMMALITLGTSGLAQAEELLQDAAEGIPVTDVRLLAPIPQPRRNIICLGKNYAAHAAESNRAWGDKVELPEAPVVFTKATTAVNGPFDDIPYDAAVSSMIDFEAELAFVIGREARHVTPADALNYVFGYTVLNDLTARDLQREHKQFFLGKSLDGHAPFGPWIVTRDEIADPQNLRITCAVNNILKQDGHTGDMIFSIAETLARLSRSMTLLPGDIVATGTPSGVGFARTPPEFLAPGDVVTCTVEHIGTIRNRIANS